MEIEEIKTQQKIYSLNTRCLNCGAAGIIHVASGCEFRPASEGRFSRIKNTYKTEHIKCQNCNCACLVRER